MNQLNVALFNTESLRAREEPDLQSTLWHSSRNDCDTDCIYDDMRTGVNIILNKKEGYNKDNKPYHINARQISKYYGVICIVKSRRHNYLKID